MRLRSLDLAIKLVGIAAIIDIRRIARNDGVQLLTRDYP